MFCQVQLILADEFGIYVDILVYDSSIALNSKYFLAGKHNFGVRGHVQLSIIHMRFTLFNLGEGVGKVLISIVLMFIL